MATNTPTPDDNRGVKVYDQPKRGFSPALLIPILLALGALAFFLMRPRDTTSEPAGNSGAMMSRPASGDNSGGSTTTTPPGPGGMSGQGSGNTGGGGGATTANPPGPAAGGR